MVSNTDILILEFPTDKLKTYFSQKDCTRSYLHAALPLGWHNKTENQLWGWNWFRSCPTASCSTHFLKHFSSKIRDFVTTTQKALYVLHMFTL